jgi:Arm DNA-binding domain
MKINRLSAIQVEKAARKGVKVALHDGAGLYLMIRPPGGASWFLRYTGAGKQRWHGLGAFPAVSLADARQRAVEARRTLAVEGLDPIAAKAGARTAALLEAAKAMSFGQCAARYVASHEAGWRQGGKSAKQWTASLAYYVYPVLGDLPVAAIDMTLVMRVLEPIWSEKTETASRVRSRIESILDWARVRGYRTGENPARWRGHLEALLPAPNKLKSGAHHAAMDYADIPSSWSRCDRKTVLRRGPWNTAFSQRHVRARCAAPHGKKSTWRPGFGLCRRLA